MQDATLAPARRSGGEGHHAGEQAGGAAGVHTDGGDRHDESKGNGNGGTPAGAGGGGDGGGGCGDGVDGGAGPPGDVPPPHPPRRRSRLPPTPAAPCSPSTNRGRVTPSRLHVPTRGTGWPPAPPASRRRSRRTWSPAEAEWRHRRHRRRQRRRRQPPPVRQVRAAGRRDRGLGVFEPLLPLCCSCAACPPRKNVPTVATGKLDAPTPWPPPHAFDHGGPCSVGGHPAASTPRAPGGPTPGLRPPAAPGRLGPGACNDFPTPTRETTAFVIRRVGSRRQFSIHEGFSTNHISCWHSSEPYDGIEPSQRGHLHEPRWPPFLRSHRGPRHSYPPCRRLLPIASTPCSPLPLPPPVAPSLPIAGCRHRPPPRHHRGSPRHRRGQSAAPARPPPVTTASPHDAVFSAGWWRLAPPSSSPRLLAAPIVLLAAGRRPPPHHHRGSSRRRLCCWLASAGPLPVTTAFPHGAVFATGCRLPPPPPSSPRHPEAPLLLLAASCRPPPDHHRAAPFLLLAGVGRPPPRHHRVSSRRRFRYLLPTAAPPPITPAAPRGAVCAAVCRLPAPRPPSPRLLAAPVVLLAGVGRPRPRHHRGSLRHRVADRRHRRAPASSSRRLSAAQFVLIADGGRPPPRQNRGSPRGRF